ncbi:MAG: creatininase family protein [Clostridiaceae bacterium]|nr:creatininase family protein [Clostridiaceae bacterium]
MTYQIKEMSWTEFDRRRKETKTVIIPTGAVEIYGPHLPMGSDGFAAMGISQMIAEKTGALIAPMLEIAESSALLAYPGTITISEELYLKYIDELMANLVGYGFENFLFISGHAANVTPIAYIARKYQLKDGIKWAQVDWWRFAAVHGEDIFDAKGRMAHGHASEAGTSVLLYFRPDLVHMEEATCVAPPEECYDYPDIMRFVPLNEKTKNATVGDATIGTAEKGRLLAEKAVGRITSFMREKWNI